MHATDDSPCDNHVHVVMVWADVANDTCSAPCLPLSFNI